MLIHQARVVADHQPVERHHHQPGQQKNERREVEERQQGRPKNMRQEGEGTEAFNGAVIPRLGPPAHTGEGTDQRVS